MGLAAVLARSAPAGSSLKDLIKSKFRSEEPVAPLGADDWLRVSSLASLCAREEVIASTRSLIRSNVVEADLMLTFAHGSALHSQLQNEILPELGVIWGQWRCLGCGALHGGKGKEMIRRPEKCSECGDREKVAAEGPRRGRWDWLQEFQYVEQWFGDETFRIGGHPDAFIQLAGLPGLGILEAKSISSRSAVNVKHLPDMSHAIQLQVYMWLTGSTWGKILYWDKGVFGLNCLIEHFVERDDATITRVKEMVQSIREGIRTGKLPHRICATSDCKRAAECSLVKTCFELPDEKGAEE